MYSFFKKKQFYGFDKNKSYFEGWYLKNESKKDSISFIPSYHISKDGNKTVSLQIVINNKAYQVKFDELDFYASEKNFHCKIGSNQFGRKGIVVNVNTDELKLYGKIEFKNMNPLKGDIMGPFQWVPCMECRHEIISVAHKLSGTLIANGKEIDFSNGIGYIEKDRGSSFPKEYFWTHCNWIDRGINSVFFSTATIPYGRLRFKGIISNIYYRGRHYRLATYRGAKVIQLTEKEVLIKQGSYKFKIEVLKSEQVNLQAPASGIMSRQIKEGLRCKVRYCLWKKSELLMDVIRDNASIESEL